MQKDMRKHTRIYLDYFGFDESDFIGCEVCEAQAVDIHHIKARGMGGNKNANDITNLMALCRRCHILYGDRKHLIEFLEDIHNKKICEKSV
jgi:5-methylcytosine-specific restriction endonuclease McrA